GTLEQPRSVLMAVLLLMGAGTLGILVFGFLVSLRFRLNHATHEVLMEEIARFKTRPLTVAPPENRRVVEDLTGWPYEQLWGGGASARSAARPGSAPN